MGDNSEFYPLPPPCFVLSSLSAGSRRTLKLANPARPGANLGTLTAHAVVASGGGDELHMRVRASALKSPRLMGTPSPYLAVHRVDPMDGERL